jgi:hypothetical protein
LEDRIKRLEARLETVLPAIEETQP